MVKTNKFSSKFKETQPIDSYDEVTEKSSRECDQRIPVVTSYENYNAKYLFENDRNYEVQNNNLNLPQKKNNSKKQNLGIAISDKANYLESNNAVFQEEKFDDVCNDNKYESETASSNELCKEFTQKCNMHDNTQKNQVRISNSTTNQYDKVDQLIYDPCNLFDDSVQGNGNLFYDESNKTTKRNNQTKPVDLNHELPTFDKQIESENKFIGYENQYPDYNNYGASYNTNQKDMCPYTSNAKNYNSDDYQWYYDVHSQQYLYQNVMKNDPSCQNQDYISSFSQEKVSNFEEKSNKIQSLDSEALPKDWNQSYYHNQYNNSVINNTQPQNDDQLHYDRSEKNSTSCSQNYYNQNTDYYGQNYNNYFKTPDHYPLDTYEESNSKFNETHGAKFLYEDNNFSKNHYYEMNKFDEYQVYENQAYDIEKARYQNSTYDFKKETYPLQSYEKDSEKLVSSDFQSSNKNSKVAINSSCLTPIHLGHQIGDSAINKDQSDKNHSSVQNYENY